MGQMLPAITPSEKTTPENIHCPAKPQDHNSFMPEFLNISKNREICILI